MTRAEELLERVRKSEKAGTIHIKDSDAFQQAIDMFQDFKFDLDEKKQTFYFHDEGDLQEAIKLLDKEGIDYRTM